jgi:hypothetical protein
MLASQVASIRKRFIVPWLALALLNLILSAHMHSTEPPVGLGGIMIALFDFYALSWVGMLTALREPRYVRAVFRAVVAVEFLPWAVVLGFMFMTAHGVRVEVVNAFFRCWFVGCGIYDLLLAFWARNQLRRRFRSLAGNDLKAPRPFVDDADYAAYGSAKNEQRSAMLV